MFILFGFLFLFRLVWNTVFCRDAIVVLKDTCHRAVPVDLSKAKRLASFPNFCFLHKFPALLVGFFFGVRNAFQKRSLPPTKNITWRGDWCWLWGLTLVPTKIFLNVIAITGKWLNKVMGEREKNHISKINYKPYKIN